MIRPIIKVATSAKTLLVLHASPRDLSDLQSAIGLRKNRSTKKSAIVDNMTGHAKIATHRDPSATFFD